MRIAINHNEPLRFKEAESNRNRTKPNTLICAGNFAVGAVLPNRMGLLYLKTMADLAERLLLAP